MSMRSFRILAGLFILGWMSTAAVAGQDDRSGFGVTSDNGLDRAPLSLGLINPAFSFNNAQVATGGVGLRNRGAGGIELSGLTGVGAMQASFLYWAVISAGPPPVASGRLLLQRLFPTPASATVLVVGAVVGTGASPCWAGDRITVFRGAPPAGIVSGNGFYGVKLLAGASGDTTGRDPFANITLPLFEGASIVAVANGGGIISVYDAGLAGKTFFGNPGVVYSLVTPAPVDSAIRVFWHNIGADGQSAPAVPALTATDIISNETTTVNSVRVAGDGAPDRDSDWNGGSADPVAQLWDNTAHDLTLAGDAAAIPNRLVVRFAKTTPAGVSDCLTPVANVVDRQ